MERSEKAEYKSLLHFCAAFGATALAFAVALSVLLTVDLFGLRLMTNGLQMCVALAEQNALDTMLYNACGCAVVEVILSVISAVALYFATPRLIRQYGYWRRLVTRWERYPSIYEALLSVAIICILLR